MTAHPANGATMERFKEWVPVPIRSWLRPRRKARLFYYDRYFRGGVIRRNGYRYRIHEKDLIGRLLYGGGHPAPDEVRLLTAAAPHFASFIDVGANIGTVTVPVARVFGGPVMAVEPAQRNYALLCENLRLNGVQDRVSPVCAAVGRSHGVTSLHLSSDNSGDHRAGRAPCDETRAVEQVELRTLEECVVADDRLSPPFLVKIDVQGFEGEVISGARPLLERSPCLILLEFWPLGLGANGWTATALFELLREVDLRIYVMTDGPALQPVSAARDLDDIAHGLPYAGYTSLVATNRPLGDVGLSHGGAT